MTSRRLHGPGFLRSLRSRSRFGSEFVLDKKKAVVTLRWVLILAASYLVLFSGSSEPSPAVEGVVVLLLASNVLIGRLPDHVICHAGFDLVLLLFDTAALTLGFYLSDAVAPDFYILYFFVVFLAGVTENLVSVLLGSVLAAVAYVSIAWAGVVTETGRPLVTAEASPVLLRTFFIFGVALFYGFLVERIRLDREARQLEYVTNLEQVNARLREVMELKNAFLGAVSHELRTPLNAILGYVDLLRDGSVPEVHGQARAYLDRVHERGQHLRQVIEELLDFSNLVRGSPRVDRAVVELRDLVERVRSVVEPAAEAKGLDLEFRVDSDVDRVLADNEKVVQVLLHLASNAVKFTDRGRVSVRIRRLVSQKAGPMLELEVSDTGPGIPAQQREAIFEAFRQGEPTLTRKNGGLGIGLSISRRLVEILGGEILLQSEVGRGTTFTVRIPVSEESPDVRAPEAAEPVEGAALARG
ncbi:MAG: hypothetical protein KatS3mg076_2269 [Candidatus Binatia bacterium]|nr:MAG: hypothetical protein KatS3mg076_2269 [Candidatus Binatia bacterium]